MNVTSFSYFKTHTNNFLDQINTPAQFTLAIALRPGADSPPLGPPALDLGERSF